jgi:hypothetical protein
MGGVLNARAEGSADLRRCRNTGRPALKPSVQNDDLGVRLAAEWLGAGLWSSNREGR